MSKRSLEEMLEGFPAEWTLELFRDDQGQWGAHASNDAVGGPTRERIVVETDRRKFAWDAVRDALDMVSAGIDRTQAIMHRNIAYRNGQPWTGPGSPNPAPKSGS